MMICPHRLLERKQVFIDCLHLLSHEPGIELHVVPEVSVPGGSVGYFLTAVDDGKIVDFLGVELQTMDTTGPHGSDSCLRPAAPTPWPKNAPHMAQLTE